MINNQITNTARKFDLEDRTTEFAKKVIRLCKEYSNNPINYRLIGQLVGSAGSIGANYREANDALGKKDFILRLRIARKEAKETIHWLELISEANPHSNEKELESIKQEAVELKNILSAIINKSEYV
ncbi:MAG: four helix bundle protein [Candidatus Kerfeldbacteria bacterium CG_4_10_14_0_8_um_filter_42_10]|uniref:Four helix bundle protein n=1 Tax=Candidatus Kerfeldbacteria bacterium CG_4_10_14_0_8_um_filter_42_10 TaxID=2014248 RepID=A0A2M7RIM9_9BACT|nr:MAG: four helix bundle protein [Candidatus Kerfeldbacteria bacterium CG_4_10_14_0_8_um_filter_42_10]